jgi:hypothetical protein
MGDTYYVFRFGATLCFEWGRAAGGEGPRLKAVVLEGRLRCDSCGRRVVPGVGVEPEQGDPSEPAISSWEASSTEALRRMADREGFDAGWRPDAYRRDLKDPRRERRREGPRCLR